jgi:hypothetical protein
VVIIKANDTITKPRFRWTNIVLPLAFCVISIVLAGVFYSKLSPTIAYHFNGNTPDRWMSRVAFLGWMIAPQLLFTFVAFTLVRIMMLGARYVSLESSPLGRLLPVMGNMLALPQIIIFTAMLEFFLYNVYGIKPFPLWIIAAIFLVLGGVFLGVFFARTIRQYKRRND